MEYTVKRLTTPKAARSLFLICWFAYFSAYLGRLNFSAVVAEITRAEGFTKSATGMVATGFFFSYGLGQLLNGFLGDRLPARFMVCTGLFISGIANLGVGLAKSATTMLVLWCINGVMQSMIWTPMLRTLTDWLPLKERKKAYLHMGSTYPAATLIVYLASAIFAKIGSWRWVFYASFVILVVVAVAWFIGLGRMKNQLEEVDLSQEEHIVPQGRGSAYVPKQTLVVVLLLGLLGISLMAQGVLKDGVFTWVPTFIAESFQTSTSLSILLTTLLPIINLVGLYGIKYIQDKRGSNEIATSAVLFGISAVSLLGLYFAGNRSLGFALAVFAVTTTGMMGINTFFVTFIPGYFARYNRVSTVSGMLNFMVYVGSGISGYGIGAIAESYGWGTLLFVLCIVASVGAVICIAALPVWKKFAANLGLENDTQ